MDCLETYECAEVGCGHVISFKAEVVKRLRRTHESFACPAGHAQSFVTKTREEKTIDRLKGELDRSESARQWAAEMRDYWQEAFDELARTCRWQGCNREDEVFGSVAALKRHMVREHGMPTQAQVREAIACQS